MIEKLSGVAASCRRGSVINNMITVDNIDPTVADTIKSNAFIRSIIY